MKNLIRYALPALIFLVSGLVSQAQTSWKGTTSTTWGTASNWTNGVPTATTNAILGDANFTGPNQPTISAAATCANLTIGGTVATTLTASKALTIGGNLLINSGSTLSQGNNTMNVSGNFTNNGTYTYTSTGAIMVFKGTAQTISGSAASTAFRKLTVNSGTVVTFSSNISAANAVNINGTLIPSESTTPIFSGSGTLNLNAGGTLKVNASTFAGNYTITASVKAGSNVEYSSTLLNQTVTSAYTYSTLTISGGTTKTLAGNTSFNSTATGYGNITVNSGTLDLSTYTANRTTTTTGGTLTLAVNTTLKIGGLTTSFFPANFNTVSLALTSNVDYNGAGTQLVSAQGYGNLILTGPSGASVRTMPATAFTVNGNLVSRVTGGTSLSYTAASAITVSGNDSVGVSTTFDAGASAYNFKVNGNLCNNGTITGNTSSTVTMGGSGMALSGSGTNNFNNLTISASGITATSNAVNVSGNLTMGVASGTFTQASGGTLTMSGSSKTITGSGFSLYNLSIATGASITTTADIAIAGNIAVAGTGTFSASAGTITMSGSSKTLSVGTGSLSFNSLFISTGASVTTATSFSLLSSLIVQGTFTASANTATFNGTCALSGTANLYNVAISSTKSLQLNNNAVLGVAGTLTNSGTFNTTSSVPNTVTFNGAAQSVPGLTYYHAIMAGSGTKTASAAVTVSGDLTINSSVTFDAGLGSYNHAVQRNFVNNGTFTAGNSTITFSGTNNATISGATTFNILTVNKSASSNLVNPTSNISAATVNMTLGTMATGTNTLTITSTRTGNGIITGIITRTHTFSVGTAYAFESPYNLVTFTGSSSVTSVTEKITVGAVSDFPFGGAVNRTYDISSITGSFGAATLRLHYEDAELNGATESSMQLWHYNGSAWAAAGKSSNDATNNYVEQTGITALTNRWSLSDNNNVVSWNGSISTDWFTAGNWTTVQGSPSKPPTTNDIVQIGDANFTGSNQPSVNAAASAKSITFVSNKASTLTLTTGGSMTVTGNINGNWSANTTHTINTNGQNLSVTGDITLSDGTANHVINMNIGSGAITIGGSLTQSGGANVNFTGAGSMDITTNFNYVSGTFTAGTGTLTYNGSAAQTVAPVTYNNLTVNKAAGIASINNTTIGGNLTANNGELDINATTTITGNVLIGASGKIVKTTSDTLSVGGNWTNNGIFTVATGAVVFNGTGAQTLSGATSFNNFIVNKTAGSTLTLAANVTVFNDLNILSGNLDLVTYTANRSATGGTFSLANGSTLYVTGASNFPSNFITYSLDTAVSGSSSTVIYNANIAQSVSAVAYGNLTFSGSGTKTIASGTATAKGNLTINNGATLDASSNMISLYGNWTNNGTFTPSTSTCMFYGYNKTFSGNTTLYRSVFYGSYTVAGTDITYNSGVRIATGGTLNAGSGTMTINGDYTNNGTTTSSGTITFTGNVLQTVRVQNAVISTSTGVVNFNGTVAPVLNSTTNTTFATVNINNTAGVSPSLPWTIYVALNVASGSSWNGGSYTHNILGSFTNNGTVTSSGVLNFTPSASQSYKLAGTSFNSTGSVVFGGTGAISTTGNVPSFTNVTVASHTGVTPGTNWSLAGNLIINDTAVLNAGANTYTIAGDVNSAGTLNPGTSVFSMTANGGNINGSTNTTFYDLSIASGARTAAGADFNISHNLATTGNLDASAATVNFTGSTASVISGASLNLSQFNVAKNAGIATTLSRNVDSLQSLIVTSGIFDAGSYTITQDPTAAAVNTLAIKAAGTFKTAGTFPALTNYTIDSLGTVEYNGAAQTIKSLSSFVTEDGDPSAYGNLTISAAGTKTANGPLNIRNDLSLATATLSFPNGGTNYADTLGGNWIMSSGSFTPGTGALVFNGGANQSINSTGAFNNITINKPAGYISLAANATVNGNITFTAGKVYTNSYVFTVPTGTISGAGQSTGWVNGSLQKTIATGAINKTFETGDAASYSPVSVSFSNVSTSGSLTAKATATEHPQILTSGIDSIKSVNRYWTLTNSGTVFTNSGATASVTPTWVATDVDAGATTASFLPALYSSSTWTQTSFASPLATSIQLTGLTGFGDIAVGQRGAKVWTGAVNTNWNTAGNWTPSVVPISTEDVVIPTGSTVSINSAVTCNNLTVNNPGIVLSVASGNTMTVNGSLTLTNGILNINGQTLTLNGTFSGSATNCIRGSKTSILQIGSSFNNTGTSLYFDQTAATFYNYLKTFTANKTVTVGNALNIAAADGANTGSISLATGATLNTGGYITLKSDSTGTARLAALPVDGSGTATAFISGNVTIERYIPARRAWRLLAAPLKSTGAPTINAAWQEGVTTASGTPNPNPGYGTHLTGGTVANGFDQSPTNGSSIKYFNTSGFTTTALPNTNVPITNYAGYFVYVRGDRSVNLSAGSSAAATATTLRMKGQVYTGQKTIAISATNYTLVANPYPSAIDFGTLTRSNVSNTIYVWDPKLGGNYGAGGYVTGTWNAGTNDYIFTGSVSPVSRYLQSGEAFFVMASDTTLPGTLTIKESDKSTGGSDAVYGFTSMHGATVKMNLLTVNADSSTTVDDGLLAIYADNNTNNVNGEDAKKINNSGENISLIRNGRLLSIEQRKTFFGNDTLFVNSTQLKQQQYRLQINTTGIDPQGFVMILKDNYAPENNNRVLSLGQVNNIDFMVNANPASSAANRFSIVFSAQEALAVNFVSVNATQVKKDINVNWHTANESDMNSYTVEASSDPVHFTPAGSVAANVNQNGAAYQWTDLNVQTGMHYYRIKGKSNAGNVFYSPIVKVNVVGETNNGINVYPNTISGNNLTLTLTGLEKGSYDLAIYDMSGRLLQKSVITHAGGGQTIPISLNNIPAGSYRVMLSSSQVSYKASFMKL